MLLNLSAFKSGIQTVYKEKCKRNRFLVRNNVSSDHVFASYTIKDTVVGVAVHANEVVIPVLVNKDTRNTENTEDNQRIREFDLEVDLYRKINDLDDRRMFAYMSQDIYEEYKCNIDILIQGHEINGNRYDSKFQQAYAYIQCYFECGGKNVCVRLLTPKAVTKLIDSTEPDSYLNTRYLIYRTILACDDIENGIESTLRERDPYFECVDCIHN